MTAIELSMLGVMPGYVPLPSSCAQGRMSRDTTSNLHGEPELAGNLQSQQKTHLSFVWRMRWLLRSCCWDAAHKIFEKPCVSLASELGKTRDKAQWAEQMIFCCFDPRLLKGLTRSYRELQ